MNLTPTAKRLMAYRVEQLVARMITPKTYLEEVSKVYQDDAAKQVEFLIELGASKSGAFRQVYNLDAKESEAL